MKILLLYNLLPYPAADHGGGKYIFNFIKHFNQKHDIYLYCTYFRKNRNHIEDIRKYVKKFIGIEIKQDKFSFSEFIHYIGRYFFSKYPIFNNFILCEKMVRNLVHLLKEEKIDLIYCEKTLIAHYLDYIPKTFSGKVYLHDDELFFVTIKRNISKLTFDIIRHFFHGNLDSYRIFQFFEYLQYYKYKKYQLNLWKKVDYLSASSNAEKKIIVKINPQKNTFIVRYGTEEITKVPIFKADPNILFIGNYSHYPNVDAVSYFGKKIFPKVQDEIKDARFLIVGRNPPNSFYEMSKKNPSIKVCGYVENLLQIFEKSQVFVCPIRLGGGFRVKLLETMAHGLPIVSSPVGIEGLYDYIKGKNIVLLAKNKNNFAQNVINLLKDSNLRNNYSIKGRKFIESHNWDEVFHQLETDLGLDNV